jgi:hypothetical protein
MRRTLLFITCLSYFIIGNSQTKDWWINNVNWDGQTHWSRYIMITSKYLGPNALSVPHINNGSNDSLVSLGVTGHFHFSKGDNTQNGVLYANYTTKGGSISVDAQFIPYERFQMSHAVKTERKTYYEDYYMKHVTGDVIANTTIQFFKKRSNKIQTALRIGVRMPSGGGLSMARYGDVPSYWIDGGFGLRIRNSHWKWIGNLGFLVWQTNHHRLWQDDAIFYGSGFEWNKNNWQFQAYASGYSGYANNGDRPALIRMNLQKRLKEIIYLLRLQKGLHDYRYFSVETGARFIFGK